MELLLALSLIPSILLFAWIYTQDKYKKEPTRLLLKIFVLGVLSVFFALGIDLVILELFGIEEISSFWLRIFLISFVAAALVEEFVKFFVVYRYALTHKAFDEVMDGIVYGVVASLGFATFENVFYVFDTVEGGFLTAIVRGILAVPGHALDGAIMGYYFGLARFAFFAKTKRRLLMKGLLLAVFFHGTYDFFLFSESLLAVLVIPLLIVQGLLVLEAIKRANHGKKQDFITFSHALKALKLVGLKGIAHLILGVFAVIFATLMLIGVWVQVLEESLQISDELWFVLLAVVLPGVVGIMSIGRGLTLHKDD